MKLNGFKNANIYLQDRGIKKACLSINGERISSLSSNLKEEEGYLSLPDSLFVVPGFVDEHIHGARNADTRDGKEESLKAIADAEAREGTTSFNFTTRTRDKPHIVSALKAISSYRDNQTGKSRARGVHLEGPFISPAYCGAQNKEDIVPLDVKLLDEYNALTNYRIKEVTFSYDPRHKDFLTYRKEHKIAPALGHSDNTCALAREAVREGVTIGTHTFNARRGIGHRERGTAGALRISDSVSCELICDFHHVCKECIERMFRCKGKDRITLITDSREAKDREDGVYHLGGQKVYVKDGAARLESGKLAGSLLNRNVAIRNRKNLLSLSREEAVDRASKNPAKNRGLYNKIGSIKEGKMADFAIVDKDRNVYRTIVSGKIVYRKERK